MKTLELSLLSQVLDFDCDFLLGIGGLLELCLFEDLGFSLII